jgi:hypothetical protein
LIDEPDKSAYLSSAASKYESSKLAKMNEAFVNVEPYKLDDDKSALLKFELVKSPRSKIDRIRLELSNIEFFTDDLVKLIRNM